jgi:hypothetical protein
MLVCFATFDKMLGHKKSVLAIKKVQFTPMQSSHNLAVLPHFGRVEHSISSTLPDRELSK